MINEIKIDTEFIKLDQFLKWAGISDSGAFAKEMIAEGQVRLNGEEVKERGKKIRPGDIIKVAGIGEFKCI
jgi:ribosome-associated protein